MPDSAGTKAFAHEQHTKAPEGAAAGAGAGGVVGGTLGVLAGIGALALPGLGPFIAAGPIMAGLSGIAAGAAVGGFTGALIGMGIPEFEAKMYETRLKAGNILLAVHTEDGEARRRALEIFKRGGVKDVSTQAETKAPQPHASRRVAPTGRPEPLAVVHDAEGPRLRPPARVGARRPSCARHALAPAFRGASILAGPRAGAANKGQRV